jgi:uncharacterized protein
MIAADPAASPPRPTPTLAGAETELVADERVTPHGPLWVATARYADDYAHGQTLVAAARSWDPRALAVLARDPRAALPPASWAFLDVETTGLGLHAGTVAFLVGIGWLAPEGLFVEQYLMRDPADEPALLHAVEATLRRFTGVVTFNGKAFDLPLLGVRAGMARRTPPHAGLAHCDLLHAARRAWSHRVQSCRLAALERQFLGVYRRDDVDGALIPQIYLDALRSGRGELLDPILTHNRQDLVSLALLTAAAAGFLVRTCATPPGGRLAGAADRAADELRAAHVYLQAGDATTAASLLERCVTGARLLAERQAGRAMLARIRKRAGEFAPACTLWEAMLEEEPHLVEPYEEIAKVLEHRRRDPAQALSWVERRLAAATLAPPEVATLTHRRARLVRKVRPGTLLGDAP